MTNLFESEISEEILNELSSALILDQRKLIELKQNELINFCELEGYSLEGLEFRNELQSFDSKICIKVVCSTEDGEIDYKYTKHIDFLKVSPYNSNSLNEAINKVIAYYDAEFKESIMEVNAPLVMVSKHFGYKMLNGKKALYFCFDGNEFSLQSSMPEFNESIDNVDEFLFQNLKEEIGKVLFEKLNFDDYSDLTSLYNATNMERAQWAFTY